MKAYLLIPFALLLGLLIGGWGPRSELRTLKQEIRNTRKLLKQAKRGKGRSDMGQVTRLLGIEGESKPAASGHGQDPDRPDRDPGNSGTNEPTGRAATGTEESPPPTPAAREIGKDRQVTMEEEIDAAIELWKLRSDIARSTFLSNGHFSDEAAMNFDVLMEAMNVRLAHSISSWVDNVEGREVSSEDGIRLMNEVTGTLVLTYDEMDRKLPENWRKTGGKSMQLMDFIDPSVARPLIRAEGKLNEIGRSMDR